MIPSVAASAKPQAANKNMKTDPLPRVRKTCLALPDAFEKEAWGAPTFRVKGGKVFAMYTNNHHDDGRIALWCLNTMDVQEGLVKSDPKNFFVPPYVGCSGWVGIRLDRGLKWSVVTALVREAHLQAASKRLRALLEDA